MPWWRKEKAKGGSGVCSLGFERKQQKQTSLDKKDRQKNTDIQQRRR
jgi:hypothetical protein